MKGIFITVRTGSTRLPNKALLKINGKHTIEYVIEQAKKSTFAEKIVLCTTTLPEDDVLCEIAEKNGIHHFRGSVEDKLDRWLSAAMEHGVDFFVTADGDDLFCSPELMDLAFVQESYNNSEFIEGEDLVSGSFTYGIETKVLFKVCQMKDTTDTEMMWVYFTKTGVCSIEKLQNVPKIYKRSDIRMTLDYQEDFDFFKTVIESFGGKDFTMREVLAYLDDNKEVIAINYHLEDQWKQNQIDKTNLVVK
jgi:spore coat polysaccharide biosynthesis protein SpsF